MDLTIQDVPVESAFAEVLSALGPLADKKSQILSQSKSDLIVRADVTRFKQMLMNLTGNAIIYPEGGHIELAAKHENGKIRIEVLDNGPGIPAEEQKRIFGASTGWNSPASPIEGTGLGSAITATCGLHRQRLILRVNLAREAFLFFVVSGFAFTRVTDAGSPSQADGRGELPRFW